MADGEESLGAYRLIERIGAGGMGEVWKAEDTRLGRLVAVKIVPPGVADSAESIARLRREARTAARLNHPNIATIHSIEEAGGRLFIVMELIEGEPLSVLMKRGLLSESELCRIGRAVSDALAEAHAKGIIHRDIKPDNIVVAGSKVKVLDFGIAKQIGLAGLSSDAPTASFLTQEGMIVGTVHYMSPEQALGKPLDPRTDIFSLGVVLYEAATGRLPFQGETITDTMTRLIRDEPAPPLRINPALSPTFNAVIQRCLRKDPGERYPTAAALARALEQPTVLNGSKASTAPMPAPKQRSPWGWIALAVALLVVVAAAGIAVRHRRGVPPTVPQAAPSPVPQAAPSPVPQTGAQAGVPAPQVSTAHESYENGERALLEHDFSRAIEQYQIALDHQEQLDPRERALAHLGIAIAMHNRLQAERMAREIAAQFPGDPDLERIRSAFAENERPMRRRLRP